MPDDLLSKPKLQSPAAAEWQPPRAQRAAQKATHVGPDTTVPSRTGTTGALNKLMSFITGVGIYPEDSTGPADLMMGALPLAGAIKGMPGFYSRLERAAAGLPEKALHPSKLMALLKNSVEGVSNDELAYRKVPEFLEGALGSVRKNDFLSHLEGHPAPTVTQRTFGGEPDLSKWRIETHQGDPHRGTDFGYGLSAPRYEVIGPDGPTDAVYGRRESAEHALKGLAERSVRPQFPSSSLQVPGGTSYRERAFEMPENAMSNVPFRGGHFMSPESQSGQIAPVNQIGHTRWNERPLFSGEPGRHIEELQSDWASAGYNEGYHDPAAVKMAEDRHMEAASRLAQIMGWRTPSNKAEAWAVKDMFPPLDRPPAGGFPGGSHVALNDLLDATRNLHEVLGQKVPPFPFSQQWPDLMLKQHLLDVSGEPDKKWLGFTTGDVQNDRYDLRKHVGRVQYEHGIESPRFTNGHSKGELKVWDPAGQLIIHEVADPEDLHRYIGHDLRDKLFQSNPSSAYGTGGIRELSSLDLTVGGEGKRQLYDKMFPSRFDKLVRPFGGRVQAGEALALRPQARAGAMNSGHLVVDEPETEGMFTGAKWHTVADLLPKGANDPMAVRALAEQVNASRNRFPRTTPTWFTSLTPEMKAAILKKGFPLLGLTGGIMAQEGEDPQK